MVSFFSLSPHACGLCLQDASANLLSPSSPAIPLCARWAAVVRGVCSRPAVSVPFSIAFITDLTNIKAWNSMCDCRFARFASAEMWRQFKDSSSSNNCCFKKVQLHVSLSKECASRMRRKLDERGIPNKCVLKQRQVAAVVLFSSCRYEVCVYADEAVPGNQSWKNKRDSWMRWPGKFVQKSCVPLKSRINKRLCKHANRTAGARGGTYGFMTWITVKRQVSKSFSQPLVLLLLGHYERSQIEKLREKKNCTVEISTPTVSKSVSWSLKLGGHMFCRKRERQKSFLFDNKGYL